MIDAVRALVARLGHEFNDHSNLELALRHRSIGKPSNERLEFLGDAVLGCVVAELLYERCPGADEGRLTRLRARLVRRETLSSVAREVDLGACLELGGSALKSGGRERDSILADSLEAVIGALYLDGGLDACRKTVHDLLKTRVEAAVIAAVEKDPKTSLQEFLQARGGTLPSYEVVEEAGAEHARRFTVECHAEGLRERAMGIGSSLRKAEQAAARDALDQLRPEPPSRTGAGGRGIRGERAG